jgi:hypothetical protein
MKANLIFLFVVGALLALVLGACGNTASISEAATQPPAETESPLDPAEVVNGFYDWYLTYEGNVLADRAYQTREELEAEFISNVDALLDSFGKGGYDPFLCAQDIPETLEIGTLNITGDTAEATMNSSLGHHLFVALRHGDSGWQIAEIRCQSAEQETARPAPTTVVNEFYSWYLSYPGNVLVDAAYRDRPELSAEFIGEVDKMMVDRQMGMVDPFLCAQDKPGRFEVQLVEGREETAQIKVSTDFEGHSFRVTVGWEQCGWYITNVACDAPETDPDEAQAPAEGEPLAGNRFEDETFGYALILPEGWTFEDVNLNEPGRPPAGNMERIVHLMPEGWAEQYIPLNLEVYAMNAADLEREIMPANTQESLEINGLTVVKNIYQFGEREMVKYDVQAPNHADLHVVLTDFLTGWPDRIEGKESVAAQIPEILNSFTFAQ